MSDPTRRFTGPVLAALTAVFAGLALWLFPKAQPTIALRQDLTRDDAIARARAFAGDHGLPVEGARVAVRFGQDDETQVYLERAAGGKPAVNREVQGQDVALFQWTVRFFRPGDPREVRVMLAPDGRVIGFRRTLADADTRPALDSVAAAALADTIRRRWLAGPEHPWTVVATSAETVQPSRRVDRTVTFERADRRLGEAPLRLDVVIRGDLPGEAVAYPRIPEAFTRGYEEQRADNTLFANIASAFVPIYLLLGLLAMVPAARRGALRWRPALAAGGVIGVLVGASVLNQLPGAWFRYDTAQPAGVFLAAQALTAVAAGLGLWLAAAVLLAMGELLTRDAFPAHVDWWQTARVAGSRPVALRILAGYTLAAFGLAYVAVFYLIVQRALGWWSPSSLLDDPNLVATPFPWLSAIAMSLQAGVLEEVLFRAVPLALVVKATRGRSWHRAAVAAAVVGSALVFGFAHANYVSWPAYARGVEIFVEAVLWAVLYLRVGLVTTIVAHVTFDLTLFSAFAAAGSAWPYRVSLAMTVLAGLSPALLVWWRGRRGFAPEVPDDARFGAWRPPEASAVEAPPASVAPAVRPMPVGAAVLAGAAALMMATPRSRVAAPAPTADRAVVLARADSLLRALGGDPSAWRRMVTPGTERWDAERAFLGAHPASAAVVGGLTPTWLHGSDWSIRYVRTTGTVAERTEGWRLVLLGDGRPHTWTHVIAEAAPRPTVPRDSAERLARAALAAIGAPGAALSLESAREVKRPARTDVEFEFADATLALPGGASARWTATVAGNAVVATNHRLFLPEAWTRASRERVTERSVLGAAAAFAAVVGLLAGLVGFARRPAMLPSGLPPRATLVRWAGALGMAALLASLNGVRTAEAAWDSTTPWDRFVALDAVGKALIILLGPVFIAGAAMLDAVRRRFDLPVGAGSPARAWRAGIVLSLVLLVPSFLPSVLLPVEVRPLSTDANAVVPWFAAAGEALPGALWSLVAVALVAGGLAGVRHAVARLALGSLVVVAFALTAANAMAETGVAWASSVAVHGLGLVAAVMLAWRYGRQPLAAWGVAACVAGLVETITRALTAAHPTDRVAAAVAGVVLVAAAAWCATQRDPDGSPGGVPGAPEDGEPRGSRAALAA